MTPAPETQFLTQADLAKRWQISARTLERWRWEGVGPNFKKIGHAVRYALADVVAYEEKDHAGP